MSDELCKKCGGVQRIVPRTGLPPTPEEMTTLTTMPCDACENPWTEALRRSIADAKWNLLGRTVVAVGVSEPEITDEMVRVEAADPGWPPACDHICLKDYGHVERGEPHFYGYEIPSPRTLLAENKALKEENEKLRAVERAARHLEANCDRVNPEPNVLATCRLMVRKCLTALAAPTQGENGE